MRNHIIIVLLAVLLASVQGCALLGPVVSPNSAIESEQRYQNTTPELARASSKLVEYERRNETLPDGTTRSVDIQTSYGIPVVPKSTTFSGSDEFIKSKTGYANLNAPDGNTVEFTKEGAKRAPGLFGRDGGGREGSRRGRRVSSRNGGGRVSSA